MTILDELYSRQVQWIKRSLSNFKDDSFVDETSARKGFYKHDSFGKNSLEDNPQELAAYRSDHLSELGLQRLRKSLEVYKVRQKAKVNKHKLDVNISDAASRKLNEIQEDTQETKSKIIERLLLAE